jgi:hypothetical protein
MARFRPRMRGQPDAANVKKRAKIGVFCASFAHKFFV